MLPDVIFYKQVFRIRGGGEVSAWNKNTIFYTTSFAWRLIDSSKVVHLNLKHFSFNEKTTLHLFSASCNRKKGNHVQVSSPDFKIKALHTFDCVAYPPFCSQVCTVRDHRVIPPLSHEPLPPELSIPLLSIALYMSCTLPPRLAAFQQLGLVHI